MNNRPSERFWELDFFRGIGIILMVVFHFLYDLNYFGGYDFNPHSGFLLFMGRSAAIIFILLVGISLTISVSRTKKYAENVWNLYPKYIKRGLRIFGWGLLLTLITWIFIGQGVIVFGILHFIGISIILAYPFLRFKSMNLLLGLLFIFLGSYLQTFSVDFPWLLWLGFVPEGFYTFDYFPLFPWFGVILIGIFTGNLLYPNYTRKFSIMDLSRNFPINMFCLMGRYSLFIYLIHQPFLIIILYLLGFLGTSTITI
ncbi:heparan-alpha-glucosaminide N-acetyltransferase [Methanohalobium sp.]|uniref:heparan-alpha-glucosaminide N-acetyltransferase n=1 Tax=Methanohalobium sp. TaxID=2837493 RepID=UPI0025E2778B|nr:heparan-alpha-glucosaminide N-acetyltransferase [Methanohalobium sp.]